MRTLASIALVLLFSASIPALSDRATEGTHAAPVPITFGDELELLLLLADPSVDTRILAADEGEDSVVVIAAHTAEPGPGEPGEWVAVYEIPPTIFAHSIVEVPFHAEEMD